MRKRLSFSGARVIGAVHAAQPLAISLFLILPSFPEVTELLDQDVEAVFPSTLFGSCHQTVDRFCYLSSYPSFYPSGSG